MSFTELRIEEFCYVTDYVANGSFASLKENVTYLNQEDYAILVRTTDATKKWNGNYIWVNKESYEFLSKSKIYVGDLIMSNVGEPGKTFIVPELGKPMTLGPNSILIRPNELIANTKFLFYYFNSILGREAINRITSATTQSKFNKGSFRNLSIPLPPLLIQKRIAEILDAADALKRKDQQLLKKYDELAQAIFIDMFGTNKKVVKLNSITTKITDGVHAKPNYQETGVPFLSVKNATNKYLDFTDTKFISVKDHKTFFKRCNPEFEDILYTKVGATYGRAAIINSKREFSIYVSLALIKPDRSKVYPYYLNFVLNTDYVKRQADRRVKGAGVPDLHLVEIKDFDIPLPSYEEQLEFSNLVEKLNDSIKVCKNQILISENLFQSLIQKAFTGELVN